MERYLIKMLNFGYTISNDILKFTYKVLQIVLDFCLRGMNKLLWVLYKKFYSLFVQDSVKFLPKTKIDYSYSHKVAELDKTIELTYERDELLRFKNGILGQYVIDKLLTMRDYLEDDISKLELDRLFTILQGVRDLSHLSKFNIVLDYYQQDCYLTYSKIYNDYVSSMYFTSIGIPEIVIWLKQPMVLMSGYVFLPKNVQERISSEVFFDFGGFDGIGALMFSNVAKQVYVFEPAEHFTVMKNNIENLGSGNIKCFNFGVSKSSGVFEFANFGSAGNEGASRLLDVSNSHVRTLTTDIEKVEITTIDEFVNQNLLKDDKLGLMKFDIEGAEYDAIQGGLETIKEYKPVMLISIYHNGRDMLEIIDLIKNFNLGYKFMLRHVNPDIAGIHEWILICYVG